MMRDLVGGRVGTITLTDTYAGRAHSRHHQRARTRRARHSHPRGRPVRAAFTTAGPHFNPENRQHGFKNPNGWHLGDLPNIDTPASAD
jgi:Cu-Zn family superoxide dismutase